MRFPPLATVQFLFLLFFTFGVLYLIIFYTFFFILQEGSVLLSSSLLSFLRISSSLLYAVWLLSFQGFVLLFFLPYLHSYGGPPFCSPVRKWEKQWKTPAIVNKLLTPVRIQRFINSIMHSTILQTKTTHTVFIKCYITCIHGQILTE